MKRSYCWWNDRHNKIKIILSNASCASWSQRVMIGRARLASWRSSGVLTTSNVETDCRRVRCQGLWVCAESHREADRGRVRSPVSVRNCWHDHWGAGRARVCPQRSGGQRWGDHGEADRGVECGHPCFSGQGGDRESYIIRRTGVRAKSREGAIRLSAPGRRNHTSYADHIKGVDD